MPYALRGPRGPGALPRARSWDDDDDDDVLTRRVPSIVIYEEDPEDFVFIGLYDQWGNKLYSYPKPKMQMGFDLSVRAGEGPGRA